MRDHREDKNSNFVRSDRLMTRREIENAAMNLKEIEKSVEHSSYDHPLINILLYGFLALFAVVAIYSILVGG